MIGARRTWLDSVCDMCLKVVLDPITETGGMHPNQSKLEKSGLIALRKRLCHVNSTSAQSTCSVKWAYWRLAQVDSWRKGRVDFLEQVIQGNLKKISSSMAIFRRWAREKGT